MDHNRLVLEEFVVLHRICGVMSLKRGWLRCLVQRREKQRCSAASQLFGKYSNLAEHSPAIKVTLTAK